MITWMLCGHYECRDISTGVLNNSGNTVVLEVMERILSHVVTVCAIFSVNSPTADGLKEDKI